VDREVMGDVAGAVRAVHIAAGRVVGLRAVVVLGVLVAEVAGVLAIVIVVAVDLRIGLLAVADGGEFDDVAVGDIPVDLGQPARDALVVVLHGRAGGLRRIQLVVGVDRIGGAEEEQFVFDQGTADGARILQFVFVAPGEVVADLVQRAIAAMHIARLLGQRAGGPEHWPVPLPVIGAALGPHFDHPAGAAAVFGAVAADQYLLLIDRVVRQ